MLQLPSTCNGLLGIGGGLVIVPMLVFCMTRQNIPPEVIMHLALGTSMATILFTAVSSFMAHHRRGAVHWDVVRRIVPGILVGALAGSCVASRLSTDFLKGFFVVFLYYVAVQMLIDRRPKAARSFPGHAGMFAAGSVIGAVSSLVGIGGGTLSVPFMLWCNLSVHHAIGTSAAIGCPIAIAWAVGPGIYAAEIALVSSLPLESDDYYKLLPRKLGIVHVTVETRKCESNGPRTR